MYTPSRLRAKKRLKTCDNVAMSTKKVRSVSFREYAILGVVALIGLLMYGGSIERAPLASAETQFVERTAQGLQIVPASCPSSPHYRGECSGNPDDEGDNGDNGDNRGGDDVSVLLVLPPNPEGTCPVGYTLNNGWCVFYGCPAGYHIEGGQCVLDQESGQCTARYFCVGNNLYQRNAQCVETLNQECAFGCAGGGCFTAPPGGGNITVTPSLVRSGERTTVAWTTNGMVEDSCVVVENNPEITDTGSGENNSFVSSVIRQQTSYVLTCETEEDGTFTDSATVNIIPIFEEN